MDTDGGTQKNIKKTVRNAEEKQGLEHERNTTIGGYDMKVFLISSAIIVVSEIICKWIKKKTIKDIDDSIRKEMKKL